jgi:translation initiation factor IF-1
MDSDGARSPGPRSKVARAVQASEQASDGEEAGARTSVAGVVTEQLPSGLYRVRLDGGGVMVAHIADRIDRNFVRVLVGDHVRLELSSADSGRGRIVAKL